MAQVDDLAAPQESLFRNMVGLAGATVLFGLLLVRTRAIPSLMCLLIVVTGPRASRKNLGWRGQIR